MKTGGSIRWYLILIVLVAFLPGAASTTLYIRNSFIAIQNNALDVAANAGGATVLRVQNFIATGEQVLHRLAEDEAFTALEAARCPQAALADYLALIPRIANIYSVDAEGRIVCSAFPRPADAVTRVDPQYFLDHARATKAYTIGNPNPEGAITGKKVVGLALPLLGADNEFRGVLALSVDLDRFSPEMPSLGHLEAYLVAADGTLIGSNGPGSEWIARHPQPGAFFAPVAEPERLEDTEGPGGLRYLAAKLPVDGTGWTVIAAEPLGAALAGARSDAFRAATLHGVILFIAAGLAFWLSSRLVRPLEAMSAFVTRIRQGERGMRLLPEGPREIHELAELANAALDDAELREKSLRIAEERLQLAIEGNQDGVWDWDIPSGRVDFSDRWIEMLGYRPDEIPPSIESWQKLIHPDDKAAVMHALQQHFNGHAAHYETEHRLRCKNGRYLWVLNRGAIVDRDADGAPIRMAGTHTDIDRRKAADLQLQRAGVIFDKSPQSILMTDEQNRIQLVNPAFERITGYVAGEVVGRNPSMLSSGRQGREFYQALWAELNEKGEWQGEIWNRRKDGQLYCEWLTITQLRSLRGITGHIAMFIDITQRKEAEAQVEWRANFDPLTKLPNRHLLLDRIDQAVKRALRDGHSGAVMLLDLDHFKEINDGLGHQAGDAVLVEVGQRLQHVMRANDTVGRLGGDEFVVLLTDLPDHQTALVASRIEAALAEPIAYEERLLQTSASIGISVFPGNGSEPDELLRLADMAMYAAKAAGRGTWQLYTPSMDQESRSRLDLLTELRKALPAAYGHRAEITETGGAAEPQIDLHFQPIVELKSGRLCKAEGLARWRHPERGMISPGQFIPLAEETGLIHPLGQLALDRALKARRRLLEAGLDCEIGVNISARQMDAQGFAQSLRAALDREDMARCPLVIEVTESLLLGDFDKGRAILQDLAGSGATIALDDFGTGYSSLSYLAQLPVNILKIDASFVKHVDSRAEVARLVRAIIDLGHDLGLQIVAEGIETEAQRDCLLAMGCDFGQGYLFAKAMPIDDLIARLQSGRVTDSAAAGRR